MRRKDIPGGVCDPCCIRKDGIKTINNQFSDPNGEFTIVAGSNIDINPAGNGIRIDVTGIDALQFMGTVGAGGTIPNLPAASDSNKGWMYIAVSSATSPVTYETGDTVISTGLTWAVIPSGNDPVSWSQIINKPNSIQGYGIINGVDTDHDQTIMAKKKFLQDVTLENATLEVTANTPHIDFHYQFSLSDYTSRLIQDLATRLVLEMGAAHLYLHDTDGGYLEGVARAYDPANTDDIATIGTLDGYTPMVRTTGNQTIAGNKQFEYINNITSLENRIQQIYGYGNNSTECWWRVYERTTTSYNRASFINFFDDNSHELSQIYFGGYGNGSNAAFAYKTYGNLDVSRIRIASKGASVAVFFQTTSSNNRIHMWITYDIQGSTVPHPSVPIFTRTATPTVGTEPIVGDNWDYVKTPVVI